jgi:hypothetical protein
MSSVTRFLKSSVQTYMTAPASGVLDSSKIYEFVPTNTNVVTNYPPGYVRLITGNAATLATAILAQNNGTNAPNGVVLRDMGKTIYTPVGSATGSSGYFRQVQLIAPQPVTVAQGSIGGPAGNTFGVLGVPAGTNSAAGVTDAYVSYLTFYIPAPVGGVLGGAISGATLIPGGDL